MLLLDGAELGHVVGVYVGLLLGFGVPLLNDEQLVRVGGAQVVIVALKAVLLLDLCQNAKQRRPPAEKRPAGRGAYGR